MKRSLALTLLAVVGLALVLTSASTSAPLKLPFAATGFAAHVPETTCMNPPQFLTVPTLQGTYAVGGTLTTTSGNVYCAQSFKATFYRTDVNGNILEVAQAGAVQSCPDNSTCNKSDTYQVTSADLGYHFKVTWVVTGLGSVNRSSPPSAPYPVVPVVHAVKYGLYIDSTELNEFQIPYPWCGDGRYCANISSGVEPQAASGDHCPTFAIDATGFSAWGGSKYNLTPNLHNATAGGLEYPGITLGIPGTNYWYMAKTATGLGCANADYRYLTDQGITGTEGEPANVKAPPLDTQIWLKHYGINPQGAVIYVPGLWMLGNYPNVANAISNTWIEMGLYSTAGGCVPANKTYFYIEIVRDQTASINEAKQCITPTQPPCACPIPFAQWSSVDSSGHADHKWENYFYQYNGGEVPANSNNLFNLRYISSQ